MSFGPPVTPDIVKQLAIANVVAFALQMLSVGRGAGDLVARVGALTPAAFWSGALWQPFTYLFLHGGVFHLAMNMLTLWMFGSPLALAWGTRRFLELYLISGVGAGFLIAGLPYLLALLGLHFPSMSPYASTLGASGAVYGIILAYSLTWPNRTIMLIFPPVAMRAIWLIPALFLLEAWSDAGNISHTGHLGGVLMAWLWLKRRGSGRFLPTAAELRWRWQRWRMRGRLSAVRREDAAARARMRSNDDHTLH